MDFKGSTSWTLKAPLVYFSIYERQQLLSLECAHKCKQAYPVHLTADLWSFLLYMLA